MNMPVHNSWIIWIVSLIFAVVTAAVAWIAVGAGHEALNRYRESFTERTQFQAKEFFLFINPNSLFKVNILILGLGGILGWLITKNFFVSLGLCILLGSVPRILYIYLKKKRLQKFETQLPDALMSLSGALRAGSNFNSALQYLVNESDTPLSQEFMLMLKEQRLGVGIDTSLNHLAQRIPNTSTILMVSAIRIAQETGGGLAETLERTAHTLRQRLHMEGKIQALTSQGKMQAWVVGMLPIGLMLILTKMEPEAMQLLWNSRIGWATLAVILFLESMGIYLIRRIVSIDI